MLTSALLVFEFVFFLGFTVAHAQTNAPESGVDAPFAPGEIVVGYHHDQVNASGLQSQLGMQAIDTVRRSCAGWGGRQFQRRRLCDARRDRHGVGDHRAPSRRSVGRLCHAQLDGSGRGNRVIESDVRALRSRSHSASMTRSTRTNNGMCSASMPAVPGNWRSRCMTPATGPFVWLSSTAALTSTILN